MALIVVRNDDKVEVKDVGKSKKLPRSASHDRVLCWKGSFTKCTGVKNKYKGETRTWRAIVLAIKKSRCNNDDETVNDDDTDTNDEENGHADYGNNDQRRQNELKYQKRRKQLLRLLKWVQNRYSLTSTTTVVLSKAIKWMKTPNQIEEMVVDNINQDYSTSSNDNYDN